MIVRIVTFPILIAFTLLWAVGHIIGATETTYLEIYEDWISLEYTS